MGYVGIASSLRISSVASLKFLSAVSCFGENGSCAMAYVYSSGGSLLFIKSTYDYSDASLYRASQYRGIGYNAVDLGPRFFGRQGAILSVSS